MTDETVITGDAGMAEAVRHGADSYGEIDLTFECAECSMAEPDWCMKASYCAHRDGPRCGMVVELSIRAV